jgi:hypothetical protein
MKFLLITLLTHLPNPVSGEKKSPADRLRDVLDKADRAPRTGAGDHYREWFDASGYRRRHE